MLAVVPGKAQLEAKDLSAKILLRSAIPGTGMRKERTESIQGCIII